MGRHADILSPAYAMPGPSVARRLATTAFDDNDCRMLLRGRAAPTAILMLLGCAALAGCSDGADAPKSQTPRVTTKNSSLELRKGLVTSGDLRSVRGMPNDVEVVSLEEMALYEDPDPRGPCGAKFSAPDLSEAVGVGLQSSVLGGFQFVVRPPASEAKTYLSRLADDTRPGCAAHDSKTNTGSMQHVELVRAVVLPNIADQRHAVVLKITNEGQTLYAVELAMRVDDVMSILVIFSPTQRSDQVVTDLTKVLGPHLRAAAA